MNYTLVDLILVHMSINGITQYRNVYLHSCRPATIYPPTPQQYDALLQFILGPAPVSSNVTAHEIACPLPIPATGENRW